MRYLTILLLFVCPGLFGQANLMYVNSVDSFKVVDINTGDNIIKFDTTSGITYHDGTTSNNFYDTIFQISASDSLVLTTYPDGSLNALPLKQFDTANVVVYYKYEQESRPVPPEGYMGFWYNTINNEVEFLFNIEVAGADSLYSVTMTNVTP